MVFFRIGDYTSGPNLSHIQSYTSIIRLGLMVDDTPDVPYYHLGTRGPSSILQARPTLLRSGNRPRTRSKIGICPRLTYQFGSVSRGQCLDVMKSPTWIRLSLCSERIPRIAENIRRDILFPPPLTLYKYQISRRINTHLPVPGARRHNAKVPDVVVALG
ncbi:hypothetical protein F511_14517 [Dorcoceras hygrometricum]|uniref:Uncharacterized protein n=1 Tax=Dorcoceras hygrometricum TaxID=472368 RepID=A0A2Z7BUU8_9LAMI|nr:hypothetical protein F511_14517 [Dorcoceras hygrometricum]